MFTEKIFNMLNELIKNQHELNIKTNFNGKKNLVIEATSFDNKIYKIVIEEGMNKKGENATVLMQLQAITDKENLKRDLNIVNSPSKENATLRISVKHIYTDKITLNYEIYEDEDDNFEEEPPIETGTRVLEDSKEILAIVRNYFEDYEMYLD